MSRVPDFANRGKCLNSGCGSGCTFFIPAPDPLPAHWLLCCAACGFGDAQTSAPQTVPPPMAALPPSATFSTMQGSRSAAAPPKGPAGPNPFRAYAQKRQADVEAKLADAGKTTGENTSPKKFDPGHTSQLEADLKPLDSTNKKRSGLPKATRKDLKEYTVVMVEDTKAVVTDKYEKPNVNKLRALNEQGCVQAVNLHGQNTAEDITAAVSAAFMPTVPQINTYGFRVLEVHAVNIPTRNGRTSKKHLFLLIPHETPITTAIVFPGVAKIMKQDCSIKIQVIFRAASVAGLTTGNMSVRSKRWIGEEFIQGKEKAVHIGYEGFEVRWTRVRIIKIN
ncbi:hypothetical protein K438DRAFT_1996720 [Mycena galopus ATCC 62051]|nr:hypothetical protein K438DRAFT_1996720 [Mycena galopus ATCC 62051]